MSTFDVVVIGGGPAGMMAAARAAQYGARTALIEKNKELGRKLMITGRGRCNYAHDEEDAEALAKAYRRGGEFLLPSLRKFGTKEISAFFLRRGIVPAHERGHRIYPKEGQDASSIVNALWTALKDGGVQVLRGIEVRTFDFLAGKARRVTTGREEIDGRTFIIATGGLSFPYTGSTGDGYRWARKAGHELQPTEPALCPIKIAERFDSNLNGLKLKNVRVTLRAGDQDVDERFGEMDFTPFGISGAIIMDMASSVSEQLKKSANVTLHIDLKPALDPERLDARIGRDFEEFSGDALRFALRKMLPGELIPEVIKMAGLDMGKPCGETTPEERLALRATLKNFVVTPTELLGFHHAIITSGGVSTDEVDPQTMASKIIPNLYFAGEVLDVDGPTGGYNLQECWSTGYAAGSAAAESLGFPAPTDEEIVRQMAAGSDRRYEQNRIERSKTKEEESEDMTIKTGPAGDSEFCGWRDPRKKGSSEDTEFAEKTSIAANDPEDKYTARKPRFSSDSRRDRRSDSGDRPRDYRRSRSERPNSNRRDDDGDRLPYSRGSDDFRRSDGKPRREFRRNSSSGEYDERPRRTESERYPDSRSWGNDQYRTRDDRPRRSRDNGQYVPRDDRPRRPRLDREYQEREDRPYRFRTDGEYRSRRDSYDERSERYERPQNDRDRPSYRREREDYDDRRPYDENRSSFERRHERDGGSRYDSAPRERSDRQRPSRPNRRDYRDPALQGDYRGRRDNDARRPEPREDYRDERRGYRDDRPYRDSRPERSARPRQDSDGRYSRDGERGRSDRAPRPYREGRPARDGRLQERSYSQDRPRSDTGAKPRTRRFTNFEQFRNTETDTTDEQ